MRLFARLNLGRHLATRGQILLLMLCCALMMGVAPPPAAATAGWWTAMPSPLQVITSTTGQDRLDTMARRAATLSLLEDVMESLADKARGGSWLNPEQQAINSGYANTFTNVCVAAYAITGSEHYPAPDSPRSIWNDQANRYRGDAAFIQATLTRLVPPAVTARYLALPGKSGQPGLAASRRRGGAPNSGLNGLPGGALLSSTMTGLAGGMGKLPVLAMWSALFWFIYRAATRRGREIRRMNRVALAEISADPNPDARHLAIMEFFDHADQTLTYRGRQGGMHFVLRKNLPSIVEGAREALRAGYLLFNCKAIDEERFDLLRFAVIFDTGATRPSEWTHRFNRKGKVNDKTSQAAFAQVDQYSMKYRTIGKDELLALINQLIASGKHLELANDLKLRFVDGAGWLSPSGLKTSVFSPVDTPLRLRLGVIDGTATELNYAGEGSLMTIAPPGAGKTQCFVIPNMLNWPGAAVVLDVKGEIYAATSNWRAENVGPVYKFSPMDPAHSASYNPLSFVRCEPDFLWEDARFLADMMIVPSGASDPFWENMARDVLTSAIAHTCYGSSPDQRPISKVMDIVYGIGWDGMLASMRNNLELSAMRQMGQALTDMERKTRDGVLKSAQSSLSAWQGERLAKVTRKSDWSPMDLRTGKPTLYICVNPNEIDSLLSVLRVFVAQHIRMLTSELPPHGAAPVLFLLDELPRLKRMPPIDEALNVGRQYGIRLWMFAQSYGQLKEAYSNAEGMLGSCAVRTFMNVAVNDEFSARLGELLHIDPVELAGPSYRDVAFVMAANTKPARVRKAPAWQDAGLVARMGSR